MRFAPFLCAIPVVALVAMPAQARRERPAAKPVAIAAPVPVDLTGTYRIDAGPDVAGRLVLNRDRTFAYALAAGALDEKASGRWAFIDGKTCLTTTPKPVPPAWRAEPADNGPTVRVIWPTGRGIPGIGVRVGFSDGADADGAGLDGGYTLEDGWALPQGETRVPRWVELTEPVYGLASPRFPFASARRLRVTLVPNDLGTVDFDKACITLTGTALVLRRSEGEMKFYRFED